MTVAQLVYPAHGFAHNFAHHSRRVWFRALHQTAARRLSSDIEVWRAVGIGLAFAGAGFAMMAAALGV
ncbi:MAG TPA: hypothetical protein VMB34_24775 [Acetobacteraceae bacterium]|nr:hypothetical protein [Acetobacteraceae bacterium]